MSNCDGSDRISSNRSPEEFDSLRHGLAARAGRLRQMAEHFALLAGETRLKIIELLVESDELCVCDLATVLEMTPAAVSQHLSRLRSGRLVQSRRDGMTIYYRIAENSVGRSTVELLGRQLRAEE